MDDKRDIYIVCIVSIVAIIGIIVLVLSNGGITGNVSKKVRSDALPGNIEILHPLNGAINTSLTPLFKWDTGNLTNYVVLYVDDELGFSAPLVYEHEFKKNRKNFKLPSETLQPGTTYYWRVVAYNNNGATNSPRYSFTTAP